MHFKQFYFPLLAIAGLLIPAAAQAMDSDLGEILAHDEKVMNNAWGTLSKQLPANLYAQASFHLNSDGTLSDFQMRHPSGNAGFDLNAHMAADVGGYARFEGRPFLFVNASFSTNGISLSSPDVPMGTSNVDRAIARNKQYHLNIIKLMKTRITQAEKVLGPNSGKLSESINFMGNEYKQIGDYAGAEAAFRRALAIREKANGPDSKEVVQSLGDLAEVAVARGDHDGAEKLFKQALGKNCKPGPELAKVMEYYGSMLFKDKKEAQAQKIYDQIGAVKSGKPLDREKLGLTAAEPTNAPAPNAAAPNAPATNANAGATTDNTSKESNKESNKEKK